MSFHCFCKNKSEYPKARGHAQRQYMPTAPGRPIRTPLLWWSHHIWVIESKPMPKPKAVAKMAPTLCSVSNPSPKTHPTH